MIKKCTINDAGTILDYIQHDYPKCLYLYLNLLKYGIESDIIDVYLQQSGDSITAVFLRYYSCLHIFSKQNNLIVPELLEVLEQSQFSMVYCTKDTAELIWKALPEKGKAVFTSGWVAQIKNLDQSGSGKAAPARDEDYAQIARMIIEDEGIGKSYIYSELAKQLRERSTQGYARNLVIKEDNTIIAHACTNAEVDGIAVVAELVVNSDYRKKGYGSDIWRCLCGQLLREGKEVYSFYYSDESRALHKKIGFEEVCGWGKIVFPI